MQYPTKRINQVEITTTSMGKMKSYFYRDSSFSFYKRYHFKTAAQAQNVEVWPT